MPTGTATNDVAAGGLWEPRRLISLEAARQRSVLVGWLRLVFIAGALAASVALLGSLVLSSLRGADRRSTSAVEADQVVRMINPRFTSRSRTGAVFEVTAESAARRVGEANLIDLVNPILMSSEGVRVAGTTGVYDTEQETVELAGAVKFADAGGYAFESDRARMLLGENRVVGRSPVHGAGPLGQLRADTYEIRDDGDVVVLRGNVRATLPGNR